MNKTFDELKRKGSAAFGAVCRGTMGNWILFDRNNDHAGHAFQVSVLMKIAILYFSFFLPRREAGDV